MAFEACMEPLALQHRDYMGMDVQPRDSGFEEGFLLIQVARRLRNCWDLTSELAEKHRSCGKIKVDYGSSFLWFSDQTLKPDHHKVTVLTSFAAMTVIS